jgi:glycosyltransferase involved in cell wall biosynthesis
LPPIPRIGDTTKPARRATERTLRSEPLGQVPLETIAASAKPMVATTAGGLAETVIDDVAGHTAPPSDPRGLAGTARRALTATPSEVACPASNWSPAATTPAVSPEC